MIGQHERSIVFQPDFSVCAADRIVRDGDVARAVPADSESVRHSGSDSFSAKLRMGHYTEGGAGDLAACQFPSTMTTQRQIDRSLFATQLFQLSPDSLM